MNNKSDKVTFLGHFTNLRKLELILENMQFKFSSLSNTNDPFENKNILFKIAVRHAHGGLVTTSERIIKDNLKDMFKVLCFIQEDNMELIVKKPRMWEQYGDMHKGCCIILRKDKLDQEFKKIKNKQNNYANRRVYYNLESKKDKLKSIFNNYEIDKMLEENGYKKHILTDYIWGHRELFIFTKMSDWSTEHEYRYSIYDKNSEIMSYYLNILNSIEEIVLGEQVTNEYTKMMYRKCKDLNIRLTKLDWINGFPYKEFVRDIEKKDYPSIEEKMQNEIDRAMAKKKL